MGKEQLSKSQQYSRKYENSTKGKQTRKKWRQSLKGQKYRIENNRQQNFRVKRIVLKHYGTKCKHCGIDDIRVLSIDHINGDGAEQRRKRTRAYRTHLYRWLIKNGFPQGLQTLCMNCQWIKRYDNNEW